MDETGLSIVYKPGRVIAELGRRNVWAMKLKQTACLKNAIYSELKVRAMKSLNLITTDLRWPNDLPAPYHDF